MQTLNTKKINLTYYQLNLIGTMIRCYALTARKLESCHGSLEAKVSALRRSTFPDENSVLELEQEECNLARMYNTDYCFNLAKNAEDGSFESSDIVEIYLLATSIQKLFTPRNQLN